MNTRNKMSIESDPRVLKCNYGSRTNYLIKNRILEKRLWYENSLLRGNKTVHNMIDLTACYDRQLAEIGSIVEESIEIERKPIQLIAKVLPIMEHYICTSFSASKEFYGGVNNK